MNIRCSFISILTAAILVSCSSRRESSYPLSTWHLSDTLSSESKPRFILINSYQFDTCSLDNIYIDTSSILSIKILPEKEAMSLFGQIARYGMIEVKTEKHIDFVSNREIYERHSSDVSSSFEKTLFSINHTFFSSSEQLYFDKEIVEKTEAGNDSIIWQNKLFFSVINIRLPK
jgi:hypothetical protein